MPSWTLRALAEELQLPLHGDGDARINGLATLEQAEATDLCFFANTRYRPQLRQTRAGAVIAPQSAVADAPCPVLVSEQPQLDFVRVAELYEQVEQVPAGIHPSAVIDPAAVLAEGVSVGPLTVIGAGARIGAGSVIGPHCVIGAGAVLGDGALLREMVSIGARVTIGARFIAQPGARIGADGFSFVTPEVSGVEQARKTMGDRGDAGAQSWMRIHSLGAVTIGDDVEIGANSTIDNGTIRDTAIGSGTKLDNLVHVGHNVRVGRDCLLCGQTGISGSVVIGDHVVLGGQCGVSDNIFIGDGVVAAGGTKILSNVPAGRVMMGYPAVKMDTQTEIYKAQRRLPRLLRDVAALQKAVFKPGPTD